MTKLSVALACALAALAFTSTAPGGTIFGVADDTGKYANDGGASFFALMSDVGFTENRITVLWDPANPAAITDQGFLDRSMPVAALRGIDVVFAVYPAKARALADDPAAAAKFASFLQLLARTYPQVKSFIVGNEPNQPRFQQPQFNADCSGASAAIYVDLLAKSYDALKAVDPGINVISSLSPRGNDACRAPNNISASPVRFIRDMGLAYTKSGRTLPLVDEVGFHPYPNAPTDSLAKGYQWPNAGVANLDRIKQAWWDAFHDTGQPVFEEPGLAAASATAQKFVVFKLAEVGWQVGVLPAAASAYLGKESVATTDEATQATIYADIVRRLSCDPAVKDVLFFGLIDEKDLDRFQAALVRADGTRRPAYDSVKAAIAETGGQCKATLVTWQHATDVSGAKPTFSDSSPRPARATYWTARTTATEDATARVGLFRVKNATGRRCTPGEVDLTQILASDSGAKSIARTGASPLPGLALFAQVRVRAYYAPLIRLPAKKLAAGCYFYAMRMIAEMNPERQSVFVSRGFVVSKPR